MKRKIICSLIIFSLIFPAIADACTCTVNLPYGWSIDYEWYPVDGNCCSKSAGFGAADEYSYGEPYSSNNVVSISDIIDDVKKYSKCCRIVQIDTQRNFNQSKI